MKLDRRRLIKAGAAAGVAIPAAGLLAACSSGGDSAEGGAAPAADSPLFGSNAENMQGKTIDFAYSRVAGWPPSSAPATLWPDFQAYAKEKYGYTVNDITFIEGGFGELFQKISP
ncbi:MAG: hypothetical protein RL008_745, partial [Actinomycetota bacterium]